MFVFARATSSKDIDTCPTMMQSQIFNLFVTRIQVYIEMHRNRIADSCQTLFSMLQPLQCQLFGNLSRFSQPSPFVGSIDRTDRIGSSRCSLMGPSHVHQGPAGPACFPKGPPRLRHPGHGNPCSDWLGIVSVLGLCAAQCCRLLLTTFTSVC